MLIIHLWHVQIRQYVLRLATFDLFVGITTVAILAYQWFILDLPWRRF